MKKIKNADKKKTNPEYEEKSVSKPFTYIPCNYKNRPSYSNGQEFDDRMEKYVAVTT